MMMRMMTVKDVEHDHYDDDRDKGERDHESRLGLEEGPPPSQGDRYSSSDNPE